MRGARVRLWGLNCVDIRKEGSPVREPSEWMPVAFFLNGTGFLDAACSRNLPE